MDKQYADEDWTTRNQQNRRLLLDLIKILAGEDLADWVDTSLNEIEGHAIEVCLT